MLLDHFLLLLKTRVNLSFYTCLRRFTRIYPYLPVFTQVFKITRVYSN
jgi:hypothetical protein